MRDKEYRPGQPEYEYGSFEEEAREYESYPDDPAADNAYPDGDTQYFDLDDPWEEETRQEADAPDGEAAGCGDDPRRRRGSGRRGNGMNPILKAVLIFLVILLVYLRTF